MKWIKLYEEFQMGDLNIMSPEEIQNLFFRECWKETPNLELIRVILDNGLIDVNVKNKDGHFPLAWVVRWGNVPIIKLLIDAGADVNAKGNYGWTPLHYATSLELAQLLLANGAKVDAKDVGGETPIHLAAEYNKLEIAQFLLANGAKVNAKDKIGQTPYDYTESQEMRDLLKTYGAV